jgi:hypothetical protein
MDDCKKDYSLTHRFASPSGEETDDFASIRLNSQLGSMVHCVSTFRELLRVREVSENEICRILLSSSSDDVAWVRRVSLQSMHVCASCWLRQLKTDNFRLKWAQRWSEVLSCHPDRWMAPLREYATLSTRTASDARVGLHLQHAAIALRTASSFGFHTFCLLICFL